MRRFIKLFLATVLLYLWVGLPLLFKERRELVSKSDGLSVQYNGYSIVITGEDTIDIRVNGKKTEVIK